MKRTNSIHSGSARASRAAVGALADRKRATHGQSGDYFAGGHSFLCGGAPTSDAGGGRMRSPFFECGQMQSLKDSQSQQGVALVITLILLSVITFMAVTFLVVSRHESE